ncbi:SdpI family protein [Lacisediminihabitans sp. FW035]
MFIALLVVAAAAVTVAGITIGCARGSIPINSVFGIRIRSVMMSEAAWRAGHRAALPAELTGAGIALGVALAGFLPPLEPAARLLSIVAAVVLLGATIVAGLFANRAALAVVGAGTDS